MHATVLCGETDTSHGAGAAQAGGEHQARGDGPSIHRSLTCTTPVPTFPSPPPKNRRKRFGPIFVALHMKMTFFRSPVYLQPSLPSQSVSYSKVGMRNWPDPRWMIFVGSSLSRMM